MKENNTAERAPTAHWRRCWQLALAVALAGWFATSALAQGDLSQALRDYDNGLYAQAAPVLIEHARKGEIEAQYKLSVMHFYGRGVPEDENEAMVWAQRAAAQGDVNAMYFIGTMYVFGDTLHTTVEDADVEAAKWYFEAARRGHADAEYGLGLLFLAGKGVAQDQGEAFKWIGRAARHGHVNAQDFLKGHPSPH